MTMSIVVYWITILFAAWCGAICGVMFTCFMVMAKHADEQEGAE